MHLWQTCFMVNATKSSGVDMSLVSTVCGNP